MCENCNNEEIEEKIQAAHTEMSEALTSFASNMLHEQEISHEFSMFRGEVTRVVSCIEVLGDDGTFYVTVVSPMDGAYWRDAALLKLGLSYISESADTFDD